MWFYSVMGALSLILIVNKVVKDLLSWCLLFLQNSGWKEMVKAGVWWPLTYQSLLRNVNVCLVNMHQCVGKEGNWHLLNGWISLCWPSVCKFNMQQMSYTSSCFRLYWNPFKILNRKNDKGWWGKNELFFNQCTMKAAQCHPKKRKKSLLKYKHLISCNIWQFCDLVSTKWITIFNFLMCTTHHL